MAGRLALTWAHKGDALVPAVDGGYEWVAPTHVRAREVRLLDLVSTYSSDAADASAASIDDNLLILGDSLDALRALARTPEYAERYRGKVKLVYIDPPFNTGQAFEHYDDGLEHSIWLGMMRERLELIRELLSPDGSVWVHLDDAEMHYAKVLMDELFGRTNFVATVVWEKVYSPRMDAKQFSSRVDFMLVFSAASGWSPNSLDVDPAEGQFRHVDEHGRRYRSDPLRKWGKNSARSDRPNLAYPIIAPNGEEVWPVKPDGTAGYWRWGRELYEARKDELDWLDKGNGLQPYVRQYADVSTWRPPETLWLSAESGHNHEAQEHLKRVFAGVKFSTPKPERLLERVIHIGSNPGDIVLDAFAGSGTTAAVAHKMGRRWVTVEQNEATVDTFTRPRLVKVIDGADPGGITESAGWTGGGGFVELRVAPPTFAEAPAQLGGGVVIAANLPVGQLPASVAAQLGYALGGGGPDSPFIAAKGRARLAVVDGLVDEAAIDAIVAALDEGETAAVAATAFTPGARAALAERAPGSRVIRIPDDLFPAAVVR